MGNLSIKSCINETRAEAQKEAQMLEGWLMKVVNDRKINPDHKLRVFVSAIMKAENEIMKAENEIKRLK